jgi:hypothetical protein
VPKIRSAKGATALPKAGVKAQPERLNFAFAFASVTLPKGETQWHY